ncbi:PD-(D/E)XK motif protein [Rathayibacter festucae]|uniref:PD-(D/E)XK motif protein n=1 Tax=Rathayibacter festucae TaxID=110937 RepID=UPI001FB2999C|nr:PD-(D/E)XK motif protein [Rathayibacter festucae]MCJ1698612.1 PD-(D/E)XK motif protein [Rathayibacter festucae]
MTDREVLARLQPETVRVYVATGKPSVHAVAAGLSIVLDPPAATVSLRVPAKGPLPDVTAYGRVSAKRSSGEFVIVFDAEHSEYEAYAMLHAAAVLIAGGSSPSDAVPAALEAFRELLSKRHRLSDEQETGLIGELTVLNLLLDVLPVVDALQSWLGPTAQPHDFALENVDLEVKTTRSNRNVHTISSLEQLLPAGVRPLVLAALRIEPTGGAADGQSLADLVAATHGRVTGFAAAFDQLLGAAGWTSDSAELHTKRYRVADTAFHAVDQSFPALTRAAVVASVPNAPLLLNASYRLDLTDYARIDAPSPLIPAPTTMETPR